MGNEESTRHLPRNINILHEVVLSLLNRLNYQNGVGSGSGGVGVTRIAFEAVPEPSTLAAVLLSAAALVRRRR